MYRGSPEGFVFLNFQTWYCFCSRTCKYQCVPFVTNRFQLPVVWLLTFVLMNTFPIIALRRGSQKCSKIVAVMLVVEKRRLVYSTFTRDGRINQKIYNFSLFHLLVPSVAWIFVSATVMKSITSALVRTTSPYRKQGMINLLKFGILKRNAHIFQTSCSF